MSLLQVTVSERSGGRSLAVCGLRVEMVEMGPRDIHLELFGVKGSVVSLVSVPIYAPSSGFEHRQDTCWGTPLVSKEPEMFEFEGASETGPALSLYMMERQPDAVTTWQEKNWSAAYRSI